MTRFLVLLALGSALSMARAGLADKKFSYVDLQPYATQKLTDNFGAGLEGNHLGSLPKGEQTFEEVPFKIAEGMLQLGSMQLKEPKPDKVEGIKVGRAFAKLYLLHATAYEVVDDAQIAEYRVRYEDGTTATIPVVYGQDVRDWWFTADSQGVTRGTVAWTGENEVSKSRGSQIRLYQGTWENPHPTKKVVSIDYVKGKDIPVAPFCIAITLESK